MRILTITHNLLEVISGGTKKSVSFLPPLCPLIFLLQFKLIQEEGVPSSFGCDDSRKIAASGLRYLGIEGELFIFLSLTGKWNIPSKTRLVENSRHFVSLGWNVLVHLGLIALISWLHSMPSRTNFL